MTPTQRERDRLTAVFRYLQELIQLRSRTVRDVADFEDQIWLSDVPNTKWCEVNAGAGDGLSGPAWLLRLRKPAVPKRPEPQDPAREWIDLDTLDQTDDLPSYYTELPRSDSDNSDSVRQLEDNPSIEEEINTYLERWMVWRDEYVPAKQSADLYDRVHSLYLQMKKEGHAYEIIAASALLTLTDPEEGLIRRHLLAIPLAIEFSAQQGLLTVSPESDLTQCRFESDMIPLAMKPEPSVQAQMEANAGELTTQIWHEPTVKAVVAPYVNERSERQYDEGIQRHKVAVLGKFVTFAPAVLLRRRGERDVLRLIGEIGSVIQTVDDLPRPLIELVRTEATTQPGESDYNARESVEEDPLFPLPANQEQVAILRYLLKHDLVRVQGPPGTGKSHTIANIVCHLLAKGDRILVTSQSPSALRVLKGLIPDELKPLSVNLLGNDQESREDLERSISGIDAGLEDREVARRTSELPLAVLRLEELNTALRENQADLYGRLNQERIGIGPIFSRYRGNPGEIAQQLECERETLGWIMDEPGLADEAPLDRVDAQRLLDLSRSCYRNPLQPAERELARLLQLPTTNFVLRWIRRLDEIDTARKHLASEQDSLAKSLAALDPAVFDSLLEDLAEFTRLVEKLPLGEHPWLTRAMRGLTAGPSELWLHLKEQTENACERLIGVKLRSVSIGASPYEDRQRIANDARRRLMILKSNPNWLRRMTAIELRETRYLEQWTVDGVPCKAIDTLEELLLCLEAEVTLEEWELEWSEHLVEQCTRMSQRIVRAKSYKNLLDGIVHASDVSKRILENIEQPDLPPVRCSTAEDAHRLRSGLQMARLFQDEELISSDVRNIETSIGNLPQHLKSELIVREIAECARSLNLTRLCENLERWEKLRQRCNEYDDRDALVAGVINVLPAFADAILTNPEPDEWDMRMAAMTESFEHAQMRTEIRRLSRLNSVEDLWDRITKLRSDILDATGHLAATMAWIALDSRVDRSAHEDLRAWGQAAKQASRTGKRAAAARLRARDLMPSCQQAVPAWVMPLYKVAEQHSAREGFSYDVAIIDEASQASPWAILLLFLAKKVLVVGDEYQTAPETVGIRDEQAAELSGRYLSNVPASLQQALTYTNSLYDVAGVKAPKRIALKEHFRCVPEIIEYSNRLCYRPNGHPLIPLRQYPLKRLDPIIMRYVSQARREGEGQSAINRREAEAIAQAIADCCGGPDYDGKKMAVLSLQGREQSRLIERLVRTKVGPGEIDARDFKFGEPYSLQGDERDIVFISMVAAPGETRVMALTKPEDQRRFNVAVSRAKDQVWLFHSLSEEDLSTKCYRRGLLAYLREAMTGFGHVDGVDAEGLRRQASTVRRELGNQPTPFDSWFEVDVCLHIASRGYRVRPHAKFGEYTVDLVVEGESRRLAVECDGDHVHGEANWEADARRQADLERCQLRFSRPRYSDYYLDRERAMGQVWRALDELGILPIGASGSGSQTEARSNKTATSEDSVSDTECFNGLGVDRLDVDDDDMTSGQTDHPPAHPAASLRSPLDNERDTSKYSDLIIEVLNDRPNRTCTEKGLADLVLRYQNRTLRGRARDAEKRKIHQALQSLYRRQMIERYRNQGDNANWRLRLLVWE